jgi:hypothetical protein
MFLLLAGKLGVTGKAFQTPFLSDLFLGQPKKLSVPLMNRPTVFFCPV